MSGSPAIVRKELCLFLLCKILMKPKVKVVLEVLLHSNILFDFIELLTGTWYTCLTELVNEGKLLVIV